MSTRYQQHDSFQDLRDYVYLTLCNHCQLQPGAYRMTERTLLREGTPCGVYFCLHGPRHMKATAIWETDRNQILFYGSDGERFEKTQWMDSPLLECMAA